MQSFIFDFEDRSPREEPERRPEGLDQRWKTMENSENSDVIKPDFKGITVKEP